MSKLSITEEYLFFCYCTIVNDRLHFPQKNMMKTTLSKTLDVWRSRRRRETSKVGAGYITPR